jgi:hypothetical protein
LVCFQWDWRSLQCCFRCKRLFRFGGCQTKE